MAKYDRKIELSMRLSAVACLAKEAGCVADVGCDHGFVSIYLMQNGMAEKVIAMDVNKGPLKRAKEHVQDYGMGDYIELRLSDGLKQVCKEDQVDTVILAGMGGKLMEKILSDAFARDLYIPSLVLQPQSDLMSFRKFLRKNEYVITEETMVLEDEKYYPMMRACYRGERRAGVDYESDLSDAFGPCLLAEKHPLLHGFLKREISKFEEIAAKIKECGSAEPEVVEKLEFLKRAEELF